jgi:ABC-type multidrug transport system ATPase subunit
LLRRAGNRDGNPQPEGRRTEANVKKIDLHIHTIPTSRDSAFVFSLSKLQEYVESMKIDGIAITNHNCFDASQFNEITDALGIPVFPGIEIDLEGGHLLLLAETDELSDFDARCRTLSDRASAANATISIADLKEIFADLSRYLMIPHYEKKPSVSGDVLNQLSGLVSAGEVGSPKKFCYCIKDKERLVPVYFSDIRITEGLSSFPTRQTYIDAGNVRLSSIRVCLRDKNKVFLAENDGHRVFDALDNGMKLSTGLTVVLGERSSGKTYILDRLFEEYENVKYIRQFSLLARDEESETRRFNDLLSQKHSLFTQEYLKEFKDVVDSMVNVDPKRNDQRIERYLSLLLKNARESERADAFSKAQLFNEADFSIASLETLRTLVSAVESLIENTEYRSIIEKYVSVRALQKLIVELMSKSIEQSELNLKKRWLNDLIGTIRKTLQVHTAATVVEDVDLYQVAIERKMVERFEEVVRAVRRDRQIHIKDVQGFTIVARARSFGGAAELKSLSGKKLAFSDAFKVYDDPYAYLSGLRAIDALEAAEYYRYFVNIDYRILNKHGFDVSGGERSEFNLLQEISDAQQYDMLLIDEPESSFDNLFLKNEVNELIKDISKSVPIVVVTHNNSVGASIKPDYVVFTQKTVVDSNVTYQVYCGYASDKHLRGAEGKSIRNLNIILDCLEAGEIAYVERGDSYEVLKD